jgi:hypothetical protein
MPARSADPPLPTFVIAGTVRSGTTALARWLRAHPDVFLPEQKELHFFDNQFDQGVDRYRECFKSWSGQTAVGEATPNYVYQPDAMGRLAETLPDAHVIVSVRHPVDRAYSHYWAQRTRSNESRSFAQAVGDELDAREGSSERSGRRPLPGYVERGRYHRQLEAATKVIDRDRLFVVFFDDMEARPTETYETLCRFVGVDETTVPDDVGQTANSYRRFRSEWVRRQTRRLPAVLRDPVGRLNSVETSYPALDPALRATLLTSYADDNAALADWLHHPLPDAWAR